MLIERYDYKPINRKTTNGKRHYCLPDNSFVPSVTTILDKTKSERDKQTLSDWKKRVGYKKAKEISSEAAGRGTRMHTYLESFILTGTLKEPGTNPYSFQSHKMAKIIIDKGLTSLSEAWGVEVPLYYTGLYAGTSDCLGIWHDIPCVLDFKQTNKPKKEEWVNDYKLQMVAYSEAHNKMYGTKINTGVILMCSKDFKFQSFLVDEHQYNEYSDQWWSRVDTYYNQLLGE